MPYIEEKYRQELGPVMETLVDTIICMPEEKESGVVTYVIYSLLKHFYYCQRYDRLADGLKVVESAKLEFYRRCVAPYEEEKMKLNGDI